jgi:hypothetical protein
MFLAVWDQLQAYAIVMWTRRWFRILSYLFVLYWIAVILKNAGIVN